MDLFSTTSQVIKSDLGLSPEEKIKLIDFLISDLDVESPAVEHEL